MRGPSARWLLSSSLQDALSVLRHRPFIGCWSRRGTQDNGAELHQPRQQHSVTHPEHATQLTMAVEQRRDDAARYDAREAQVLVGERNARHEAPFDAVAPQLQPIGVCSPAAEAVGLAAVRLLNGPFRPLRPHLRIAHRGMERAVAGVDGLRAGGGSRLLFRARRIIVGNAVPLSTLMRPDHGTNVQIYLSLELQQLPFMPPRQRAGRPPPEKAAALAG